MSIRSQLFTGFSILIMVFFIDFIVNKRLSNVILKNTTYLNNSESVIRNSNMLQKEMIEMQSGFRGFLLTGQAVFLEPYYTGISTVPGLVTEQQALISSPTQKQKLDSVVALHLEWVEYANSLISTKLDTLPEANAKYIELFNTKLRMEVGKKLNDKIQKIFASFDNKKYQLRQERRAALQKSLATIQTLQERDAFESTGVGLAIVKKIIEDYKGTIRVESEPGKGSSFMFTWPKHASHNHFMKP